MGIDYSSVLIFGWMIKREKLLDLLDEDQKEDLCVEEYLDEIREKLPKGCYLFYCCPYYDCSSEDNMYYISLMDKEDSDYTLNDLNQLVKDSEAISQIRKFAINLGADDKEPKIFSDISVY